jgi:hypothetical protein
METAVYAEMLVQFKNKTQLNPENQKIALDIVLFTREY